ncbi:hypothetical protein CAPTEDRAFT_185971 [Capitella teleta]|uniref:Uncharacterized protein n=1 Tax=Capitella teleta TaxID=283909 RepID=R7TYZ4_CAPTE|nr:hypothetical protein CAPTEDRAFT_185971 [Capitella teleta]|eukprot:ELT96175.1 hypothetical protein CAPTEDRAFT_185971 [Capitella teleta]
MGKTFDPETAHITTEIIDENSIIERIQCTPQGTTEWPSSPQVQSLCGGIRLVVDTSVNWPSGIGNSIKTEPVIACQMRTLASWLYARCGHGDNILGHLRNSGQGLLSNLADRSQEVFISTRTA